MTPISVAKLAANCGDAIKQIAPLLSIDQRDQTITDFDFKRVEMQRFFGLFGGCFLFLRRDMNFFGFLFHALCRFSACRVR